MPFSYSRLFLEGSTFCCCLPVRLGVISMSILGCLVAGLLTVVLWFEVSSDKGLTSGEHAAFIVAALTETALLGASVFGLVGAIARKQFLIRIYSYILYVHFALNLGVASYLAFEIIHVTTNFEKLACQTAIKDPQAQGQCEGFLGFARWVYIVIAVIVLVVELYGAVVVTRYLNQLKRRKANARSARMDTDQAFQLDVHKGLRYTRLKDEEVGPDSRVPAHLPSWVSPGPPDLDYEYNPYTESELDRHGTFAAADDRPLGISIDTLSSTRIETSGDITADVSLARGETETPHGHRLLPPEILHANSHDARDS